MRKIYSLIRYSWLLHFFYLCTNWLPDNVIFIRLRGRLFGFCLGSCGKRFGVGRNVTFYNPQNIHIGDDVYIAFGCWFNGTGGVFIEDEVLFGPYVVISPGNHTKINGSFRNGAPVFKNITIGKGAWIGSHCTLVVGASIGKGSLVAANSILNKHTENNSLYGGVPAKFIKNI